MAAITVSAQPWTFTPEPFAGELQEAAQRVQSNFTGFVFNFAKGKVRLTRTPVTGTAVSRLSSI